MFAPIVSVASMDSLASHNMARVASSVKKEVSFYAYVMGGVLNLRWNVETMLHPALTKVMRDFLVHLYDGDEWKKIKVLDAIRDKSRNQIKDEARQALPSLFAGRAAWPLALPKEASTAKFDIDFIYKLKERIEEIRKGDSLMEEQNNVQQTGDTTVSNKAPRFHLPAGVTPEQLTVDNFRTLTGRRFRVTTEQHNRITAGTLTRDGAFAEFVADLKKEQS